MLAFKSNVLFMKDIYVVYVDICLLHFKPLALVTMHQGPLSFCSALHPDTCLQGMTIYFRPLPERPS